MTPAEGRFSDLSARLASGAVLAVIGVAAVWSGGLVMLAFVAAIVGIMVWELARMLDPAAGQGRAIVLAVTAAVAVVSARILPEGLGLPLLFLPVFAGLALLARNRTLFLVFTLLIGTAGFGLHIQRDVFGFVWIAWLISVVIVTDVVGYFAGRIIGGPKFWPRVSPKKTWSGTVAGWLGAICVGLGFMHLTGAGYELLGVSVAVAMASQVGDIAESAIKRRMGVKDASHIMPGHGGLLDRFDGMLGAAIFLLFVEQVVEFPPGLPVP
jgi:phosphatidate cytidylyltransferase